MNRILSTVVLLLGSSIASLSFSAEPAPVPGQPVRIVKIWPGVAPGSENWQQKEAEGKLFGGDRIVRNVVSPSLEIYRPEKGVSNSTGVLICPGGAFRFLSIDSEGVQVARWLSSKGYTAFLLRYRLGETAESDAMFTAQLLRILPPLFAPGEALLNDMKQYGPPAIADGRQALKFIRERAAEFGVKTDRIGILGFSAGGVVATGVSIDFEKSSRPDFIAAIYPGPWPVGQVPENAPPLFIAAANDDGITTRGAKPLEAAWVAAKIPVEAHYYENGGHGFGMKKQGKPSDVWTDHLLAWLDGLGLAQP